MSRPALVMLVVVLAALPALAACTRDGDKITVSNAPQAPAIAVSGHGEIEVPSDVGYIDVGVSVQDKTVAAARDRAAAAADAVISSVKKNGVEQSDIKTLNFNIYPQYESRPNTTPTIVGYTVTNTVQVKVKKLADFSKIVDDAAKAGGNDARINGIRFGVDDNAKAIQQARERAMADAKQKAEQLAKLGGVNLGKPITINETQSTQPPVIKAAAAGSAQRSDVATPIEPGTGTVSVELSVTWSIAN